MAEIMGSSAVPGDADFPFLPCLPSLEQLSEGLFLASSGTVSVRRFFSLSLPEDTDEAALSCHPDEIVAIADDASSGTWRRNRSVFDAPEELDRGMWRRKVVRASVW